MWVTCASQVSRFLLSLKTIQYELPFRHHDTSTADQIIRVDRGRHLDFEVELSPFQESTFRRQKTNATKDILHHEVVSDHNKVPLISHTTPGEQQGPAHQQTGGWFASFFRVPPRHRHVEVDADAASQWVEGEDRGPGMQESQIGRYDAWL